MSNGIQEETVVDETGPDTSPTELAALADDLDKGGNCIFCGRDPYHYEHNGVGLERVAVVCCESGIALYQHGDEQLSDLAVRLHRAAHALRHLAADRRLAPSQPDITKEMRDRVLATWLESGGIDECLQAVYPLMVAAEIEACAQIAEAAYTPGMAAARIRERMPPTESVPPAEVRDRETEGEIRWLIDTFLRQAESYRKRGDTILALAHGSQADGLERALEILERAREPDRHSPGLIFTYTNYKGETAIRTAVPISIRYGSSEWHPEPQWLLRAFDTEKQAEREFALKDIGARVPDREAVARALYEKDSGRAWEMVPWLEEDRHLRLADAVLALFAQETNPT